MMLLINICKEKLHNYEFVKPIEEILRQNKLNFKTLHYSKITKKELSKPDKIIICGTSLKDNEYLKNIEKFSWIKNYKKPLLGICGGMQIIELIFNGKRNKKQEIGLIEINFKKEFLGLKGKKQVYNLHNYFTESTKFSVFAKSSCPQAVKHKTKEIYGTLFHPEVRNKKIITNFCKISF